MFMHIEYISDYDSPYVGNIIFSDSNKLPQIVPERIMQKDPFF